MHFPFRPSFKMAATSSTAETKLHYFNGRGLGEQIRFMLAACGIEWVDCYLTKQEHLRALRDAKLLIWDQVPLLELPGPVRIMQSMAAVRHLARMHDLYGKDDAEMTQCDIIGDGIRDCLGFFSGLPFAAVREEQLAFAEAKMRGRYLPCLERQLASNGAALPDTVPTFSALPAADSAPGVCRGDLKGPFLVGSSLTFPDVTVTEILCYVAELLPELASSIPVEFPLVAAHQEMMLSWDHMRAFLTSSHRHRLGDDVYRDEVRAVLG